MSNARSPPAEQVHRRCAEGGGHDQPPRPQDPPRRAPVRLRARRGGGQRAQPTEDQRRAPFTSRRGRGGLVVGVRDCHGPGGVRERAHEPRRKALPLVILLKGNRFLDNLLCVVSAQRSL